MMNVLNSVPVPPRQEISSVSRPRALYQRIQAQILEDLRTSNIAAGEKYCTEEELARRFNVCRTTIRKAMASLEEKGYFIRRQRIGTIIGEKLSLENAPLVYSHSSNQRSTISRQRLIVVLPGWNDEIEGFYTSQLLHALSSPEINPPFAIEIRHHKDSLIPDGLPIYGIVATDPGPHMIPILQKMADQGVKVIVLPGQPIEGLVNLYHDRYRVIYETVKDLYQMGHRAVGLINGIIQHMDFENSYLGYLDAHRELDIPIHPRGIIQARANNNPSVTPDIKNITAWICTSSNSINQIVKECWKADLKVPDDVSIFALDDLGDIPLPLIGKKLSVETIDFDATAALIQTIFNDWKEERRGSLIAVPSKRIDRETIAPPRAAVQD
jgi:DNA-binding transcriptional regulator YhcF (GntR family)